MKLNAFHDYDRFISKVADEVPLLKLLYKLNYPIVYLFLKLKINPNTVTTLSNLSALISFAFFFDNFIIFSLLWFFALSLDLCDGMIARAQNFFSPNGGFYDHYSDVFKILFLFLLAPIKYNTIETWILSAINIISFSCMVIANLMLQNTNQKINEITRSSITTEGHELNTSKTQRKSSITKRAAYFIYTAVFVIYGNFNLLLIPLGHSKVVAIFTMSFTLIITFKNLLSIVRHTSQKNVIFYNLKRNIKNAE